MVHMKCYIGMLKGLVLKVLIPTSSVCFFQMYFFLFTYASEATEHIIKIWVVYNGWIYCVVFAVSWINSLFNLSMLTLYWAESPVRYLLKKKIQCGPVGEFLYLTVFTIIHYIKHITHTFPAHRYLMVKNIESYLSFSFFMINQCNMDYNGNVHGLKSAFSWK